MDLQHILIHKRTLVYGSQLYIQRSIHTLLGMDLYIFDLCMQDCLHIQSCLHIQVYSLVENQYTRLDMSMMVNLRQHDIENKDHKVMVGKDWFEDVPLDFQLQTIT
jgi:hypothetical protein